MAMKDDELVIWNEVHPSYTLFHKETETFSSLWSHYDGNIHHFQRVYAEDITGLQEQSNELTGQLSEFNNRLKAVQDEIQSKSK